MNFLYPQTKFTTDSIRRLAPLATLLPAGKIEGSNLWPVKSSQEKLIRQDVDCFPLYSILVAANRTEIDFCNLSLGGLEFEVLQTVPFEKVDIKVDDLI
jgi:hypothetical protein